VEQGEEEIKKKKTWVQVFQRSRGGKIPKEEWGLVQASTNNKNENKRMKKNTRPKGKVKKQRSKKRGLGSRQVNVKEDGGEGRNSAKIDVVLTEPRTLCSTSGSK